MNKPTSQPPALASCSPNEDLTTTMDGVQIAAQILRTAGYDLSAKRCESLIAEAKCLLSVAKSAYRKHHLDHENIGWDQLGDQLCDALCNAMGNAHFQQWISENSPLSKPAPKVRPETP